ncbi:uncharacterized protein [Musca autumnalis]|uniref:uncharacterized protein n=1 Tax=Musca autumnalis TaxID=221902 RepID=UPI003CF42436
MDFQNDEHETVPNESGPSEHIHSLDNDNVAENWTDQTTHLKQEEPTDVPLPRDKSTQNVSISIETKNSCENISATMPQIKTEIEDDTLLSILDDFKQELDMVTNEALTPNDSLEDIENKDESLDDIETESSDNEVGDGEDLIPQQQTANDKDKQVDVNSNITTAKGNQNKNELENIFDKNYGNSSATKRKQGKNNVSYKRYKQYCENIKKFDMLPTEELSYLDRAWRRKHVKNVIDFERKRPEMIIPHGLLLRYHENRKPITDGSLLKSGGNGHQKLETTSVKQGTSLTSNSELEEEDIKIKEDVIELNPLPSKKSISEFRKFLDQEHFEQYKQCCDEVKQDKRRRSGRWLISRISIIRNFETRYPDKVIPHGLELGFKKGHKDKQVDAMENTTAGKSNQNDLENISDKNIENPTDKSETEIKIEKNKQMYERYKLHCHHIKKFDMLPTEELTHIDRMWRHKLVKKVQHYERLNPDKIISRGLFLDNIEMNADGSLLKTGENEENLGVSSDNEKPNTANVIANDFVKSSATSIINNDVLKEGNIKIEEDEIELNSIPSKKSISEFRKFLDQEHFEHYKRCCDEIKNEKKDRPQVWLLARMTYIKNYETCYPDKVISHGLEFGYKKENSPNKLETERKKKRKSKNFKKSCERYQEYCKKVKMFDMLPTEDLTHFDRTWRCQHVKFIKHFEKKNPIKIIPHGLVLENRTLITDGTLLDTGGSVENLSDSSEDKQPETPIAIDNDFGKNQESSSIKNDELEEREIKIDEGEIAEFRTSLNQEHFEKYKRYCDELKNEKHNRNKGWRIAYITKFEKCYPDRVIPHGLVLDKKEPKKDQVNTGSKKKMKKKNRKKVQKAKSNEAGTSSDSNANEIIPEKVNSASQHQHTASLNTNEDIKGKSSKQVKQSKFSNPFKISPKAVEDVNGHQNFSQTNNENVSYIETEKPSTSKSSNKETTLKCCATEKKIGEEEKGSNDYLQQPIETIVSSPNDSKNTFRNIAALQPNISIQPFATNSTVDLNVGSCEWPASSVNMQYDRRMPLVPSDVPRLKNSSNLSNQRMPTNKYYGYTEKVLPSSSSSLVNKNKRRHNLPSSSSESSLCFVSKTKRNKYIASNSGSSSDESNIPQVPNKNRELSSTAASQQFLSQSNFNSPLHRKIVFIDRSNPKGTISNEIWKVIEGYLLKVLTVNIQNPTMNAIFTAFNGGFSLENNIKVLECDANPKVIEFLENAIKNVGPIAKNIELLTNCNILQRTVIGLIIPPPKLQLDMILKLLKQQNQDLISDDWSIVHSHDDGNNFHITLEINGISFELIRKSNGKIKFGQHQMDIKNPYYP